jgi:hypothetical protein
MTGTDEQRVSAVCSAREQRWYNDLIQHAETVSVPTVDDPLQLPNQWRAAFSCVETQPWMAELKISTEICGLTTSRAGGSRQSTERRCGFTTDLHGSRTNKSLVLWKWSRTSVASVTVSDYSTSEFSPRAKMSSIESTIERMDPVIFVRESARQNRP